MMAEKKRQSAFDCAANYLSYQDRTEKELRDKLKRDSYSEAEISSALDKLREYGYFDDERYARMYLELQASRKGAARLRSELSRKGISHATLERVLSEFDTDETVSVRNLIARRFADTDFDDEKQCRRVCGFFQRRGFTYADIKSAIYSYKNSDKYL